MDQQKGAGHSAITHAAVKQFFEVHNHVLGLDREQFFAQLDHWQAYADRIVGGDTWQPSEMNGQAQRHHAMADPRLSGDANLHGIREWVVGCMDRAKSCHENRDHAGEMRWLGAGVHALQDSYSGAHMFRDPAHLNDPEAKVIAICNFDPVGPHNTHDSRFDKVTVTDGHLERPADQAGASATATLLAVYQSQAGEKPADSHRVFDASMGDFFQGSDVHVLTDPHSAEYKELHGHQLGNEICWDPSAPDATDHATSQNISNVVADSGLSDATAASGQFAPIGQAGTQANVSSFNPGVGDGHSSATAHHVDYSVNHTSFDPGVQSQHEGEQANPTLSCYDASAGQLTQPPHQAAHSSFDPGTAAVEHVTSHTESSPDTDVHSAALAESATGANMSFDTGLHSAAHPNDPATGSTNQAHNTVIDMGLANMAHAHDAAVHAGIHP